MAGSKRGRSVIEEWLDGVEESDAQRFKRQRLGSNLLGQTESAEKPFYQVEGTKKCDSAPHPNTQDDGSVCTAESSIHSESSSQATHLSQSPSPRMLQVLPPAKKTEGWMRTIVAVEMSNSRTYLVRSALLDSSVRANFIQHKLVKAMELEIKSCGPQSFPTMGTPKALLDQFVEFPMWMAGVRRRVRAYVYDYFDDVALLHLGPPTLRDFHVEIREFGTGSEQRVQATTTVDIETHRSIEYLIPADYSGLLGAVDKPSNHECLLAAKVGETRAANAERLQRGMSRCAMYYKELSEMLDWD